MFALFSRRSRLGLKFPCHPAMNRWATIIRPLRGLGAQTFCASPLDHYKRHDDKLI